MASPIKLAVIGLGLVVGMAAAAQAQSVSSLPPAGGVPTQSAATQPFGSPQSYYPKAGGNSVWKDDHYQPPADYSANAVDHPYSTSIGPKAGSHSSGVDRHYEASSWDDQPVHHPYDAKGVGPRAN
jgi:hypothetical protein